MKDRIKLFAMCFVAMLAITMTVVMYARPAAARYVSSERVLKPSHSLFAGGSSYEQWTQNSFGMLAIIQIPSVIVLGDSWEFYLESTDTTHVSFVGVQYDDFCGSTSGLEFFYDYQVSGVGQASHCYDPTTLNGGAVNASGMEVEVGTSHFTSGGGGTDFWIHNIQGTSNTWDPCSPCTYASTNPTYTANTIEVTESSGSNGSIADFQTEQVHAIRYLNTSGTWTYQTTSPTRTLSANTQPYIAQTIGPATGNNGGAFALCSDNDSTASC